MFSFLSIFCNTTSAWTRMPLGATAYENTYTLIRISSYDLAQLFPDSPIVWAGDTGILRSKTIDFDFLLHRPCDLEPQTIVRQSDFSEDYYRGLVKFTDRFLPVAARPENIQAAEIIIEIYSVTRRFFIETDMNNGWHGQCSIPSKCHRLTIVHKKCG